MIFEWKGLHYKAPWQYFGYENYTERRVAATWNSVEFIRHEFPYHVHVLILTLYLVQLPRMLDYKVVRWSEG